MKPVRAAPLLSKLANWLPVYSRQFSDVIDTETEQETTEARPRVALRRQRMRRKTRPWGDLPRVKVSRKTLFRTGEPIWSLDVHDQRRLYQTITPDKGLTLRQAMLVYHQEGRAEEFLELEALGYDGRPPDLVQLDGSPTDRSIILEFDRKARNLREARIRLQFALVEKLVRGTLHATGFGVQSALDQPATPIAADRWRVLKPDFELSTARGKGVVVSGILVFPAKQPITEEGSRSVQFARSKLETWYKAHVAAHVATGSMPSRDDDQRASEEAFGKRVSRDVLRELRRTLAPEDWTRHGRRKRKP